MKEIWKDIVDYEGLYQISNLGRVKSTHSGEEKILKFGYRGKGRKGYLFVNLHSHGKSKKGTIHRLVADAFIEKQKGRDIVNHKDGNKQNNVLDNLEWCNYSENIKHAYDNGLNRQEKGEKHHKAKLKTDEVVQIKAMLKESVPIRVIGKIFNVNHGTISCIKSGKSWSHINDVDQPQSDQ